MKKRRAWTWIAGAVGALLLLLGAFFAWVQAVAARRWAELERRIPELVAEAKGRERPRPVLRGEAVPGNAWDDYGPALTAMKGVKSSELGDFVGRAPAADRGKVEALLAAHGATLDLLRAGARKAEGVYPLQFEKGFAADLPGLLQSQNLVNLAVCRARFLLEEGKTAEAVELLLDAAQFGSDLGRNTLVIGEMISIALMGTVFEELKGLALDPARGDVDWAGLGRALELLDRSFPDHGVSMKNEGASSAAGLADPKMVDEMVASERWSAILAWRYGFSTRLMIVDAVETQLDLMERAAEASRASWSEARRIGKDFEAELAAEKNPIAAMMIPGLLGAARAGRERRAHLRLLRTAVALRAGEPPPELDDPFGAKLRTDGSKVWSVGQNGEDDGGQGGWRPERKGDIVLELPRK